MVKVVYNADYGGFSLSERAVLRYAEIKGLTLYPEKEPRFGFTYYWLAPPDERDSIVSDEDWWKVSDEDRVASNKRYAELVLEPREISRTDPVLVRVVEELGESANGEHARLRVAEVTAGVRYRIDEYDGRESVMTVDDYEWMMA